MKQWSTTIRLARLGVFFIIVLLSACSNDNQYAEVPINTIILVKIVSPNDNPETGDSQQLQAMGKNTDQRWVDMTDKVQWKSSDPRLADVNETGWMTTKKAGSVDIRAEYAGQAVSVKIVIKN